jgi:alpha-galactosidase
MVLGSPENQPAIKQHNSIHNCKQPSIMKKTGAYLFLFLLLACNTRNTEKVWLDELDLSKAEQAAGLAIANKSMWNTPLIIAGDTFERGVGTHASGIIRIKLGGDTKSFHALVGVDDSAPPHELAQASAEFIVYADGKELWRSGLMRAGDKARKVEVNVKGVDVLSLYVDHAGDGIIGDRTNWVDAWFQVAGKKPYTWKPDHEEKYSLTPGEPLSPLINPPYIHGVGTGNPVSFMVPVSGERPITYTAKGLPEGLSIDRETGLITGKSSRSGQHLVTVTAENTHGSDQQSLLIVVGNTIALTPPMGWNSWNVYGSSITQEQVKKTAEAMVSTGLINYGYTYICIDDGWQGERGGKYNAIQPNDNFPGMKELVEYIHSLGLKAGIYSSPWVWTYAGYMGGAADTPSGEVLEKVKRHGEYKFHKEDVAQWVDWGFDYLKYDWNPIDVYHTELMTNTLRNSGRDFIFSISNSAPIELANEWARLTNLWRTTFDIHDSWWSLISIGFTQDKWKEFAGPGHWNDPDMLVVGKVGWGEIRDSRLSPNEQYTHITLWSILAAPLMIGCDLTNIDDFTLNLLKNREVLAVNQDAAGIQGYQVISDQANLIEIWAKPLHDGSLAVGLFNLNDKEQEISIGWSDLKISGNYTVRDIWTHTDIGEETDSYSTNVAPHGVQFIRLTAGSPN